MEHEATIVRNLLSSFVRLHQILTPRIHAPILSPLIRTRFTRAPRVHSRFFYGRLLSAIILFSNEFRRKMGWKKKRKKHWKSCERLVYFGGYREKYLKKYLHDCETNFITGVMIRRIYYRGNRDRKKRLQGFLARRVSVWLASSGDIIALESGTNSFECDERSNSPSCLSYCFIHSTVTIFTVPYPDEYYEGNKEGK